MSDNKSGYNQELSTKDIYHRYIEPGGLSALQSRLETNPASIVTDTSLKELPIEQDGTHYGRNPISTVRNSCLSLPIQKLLKKHQMYMEHLHNEHIILVNRLNINKTQLNSEILHMKCLHDQMEADLQRSLLQYQESTSSISELISVLHRHEMQIMSINSRIVVIQTKL